MTDIEKLQKEVRRRYEHHIECMKRSKDDNYPALSNAMHGFVKDELFEILCFMDSLPKESVSEDFEKAAEEYVATEHPYVTAARIPLINAFKAGGRRKEEQLKLTWLDMMHIHKHIKDAMNLHFYKFQSTDGQQEVYQNVLDRFIKERYIKDE